MSLQHLLLPILRKSENWYWTHISKRNWFLFIWVHTRTALRFYWWLRGDYFNCVQSEREIFHNVMFISLSRCPIIGTILSFIVNTITFYLFIDKDDWITLLFFIKWMRNKEVFIPNFDLCMDDFPDVRHIFPKSHLPSHIIFRGWWVKYGLNFSVMIYYLPLVSEGWGRYCFHRCLSVHPGPFWRSTQSRLGVGSTPVLARGGGTPVLVRGRRYPIQGYPAKTCLGYSPGQYMTGVSSPPRTGVPPPPNRGTEQQSKHLLRGGQYASCVHAGGVSCSDVISFGLLSNGIY